MAQKRVPSIEDAVANFRGVMERASLTEFIRDNRVLLSIHPNGYSVIITIDDPLWDKLMEDEEFKKKVRELNITDPLEHAMQEKFALANGINDDTWIDMDTDKLYAGEVIKISIDGFTYEITVNKNSLPVKLRKAEFNQIAYRVFVKPSLILGIKKKFDTKNVENGGFTMMRIFQII